MSKSIAKIAVPVPVYKLFDYKVPAPLQASIQPGMRVQVPFGKQEKIGIVVELSNKSDFKRLKSLGALLDESPLLSPKLIELILWGARHYLTPPGEAFHAALPANFWKAPRRRRSPTEPKEMVPYERKDITLSPEQTAAIDAIWNKLEETSSHTHLLHGVTGSGKTEVYLELARRLLKQGHSVLLLAPEISLTPQLVGRCQAQLSVPVGLYHSGLTARQREEIWEQCAHGQQHIIVGTRSALFLPLQSLRLIIVDEEHDSSLKQEERFRYNARDLAVVRGQLEQAVVVLGSATPSLESYRRCQEGKYTYLHLPDRPGAGKLPEFRFIDLREKDYTERDRDEATLISRPLSEELNQVLQRGEQALLFLNRRGFSPVRLCQDCGEHLQCPNCHITLTLHKQAKRLRCHYCEHQQQVAGSCGHCGSSRVTWVGSGTERVEDELKTQFPRARIARLDRDTTQKKGALEETLLKMRQGEIDILVGTQILTKGHDYDKVTLVGVLLAEASLNFPDFRAAERTFQLITQVAGRAGRGERPGRVLVQGFQPDHYALQCALAHDFEAFFKRELKEREALHYAPYYRLIQLILRAPTQRELQSAAERFTPQLHQWLAGRANILGPAPCPLEKLRGQFRWHYLLKTQHYAPVRDILQAHLDVDLNNILPSKVSLAIDVDPLNML